MAGRSLELVQADGKAIDLDVFCLQIGARSRRKIAGARPSCTQKRLAGTPIHYSAPPERVLRERGAVRHDVGGLRGAVRGAQVVRLDGSGACAEEGGLGRLPGNFQRIGSFRETSKALAAKIGYTRKKHSPFDRSHRGDLVQVTEAA